MLRHITDAASSCSLCFFGCFDVVWADWKLELHNVNQVKLQMWHQSTLSTMRPGFNTSTTPTPPTILRWQYFLKSWVLFFSKIVHHFLLKANLIFLRSSGQSGDLVTEVVSKNIMGNHFPKPLLQFTISSETFILFWIMMILAGFRPTLFCIVHRCTPNHHLDCLVRFKGFYFCSFSLFVFFCISVFTFIQGQSRSSIC